jgi:hypothetical protein
MERSERVNRKMRSAIVAIGVLLFSMALSPSNSYESSYSSLSEVNEEVVFLGDVLTIDAGWCTATTKPTQSYAKKRLEIYKSGKWVSVGKVIYPKASICSKKTPFLQQFQWEVDELGVMNPDQVSGILRLRNSAVKPTIYTKLNVFESESAYQSKLSADEEADRKAREKRALEAGQILGCLIRGGEWNSVAGYCVLPPG